ncbi:MAG: carbon-nitrogen hydrolase family protein, partial [Verrucomicrobiales bacterium]|nr:carbon-nitrogen hydrolase family protein [Verrucomicrobiales bacterium]
MKMKFHHQDWSGKSSTARTMTVTLVALLVLGCVLTNAAPTNTVRVAACQAKRRLIDWHINQPAEVLAKVDENLAELERIVERAGQEKCDALAFPEDTVGLLNWMGMNEAALKDVLPKAVTRMLDRLGRAAAKHRMYLVVCSDLVENDGATYNTAFFLGRDGKEIGRYHKVCPTWGESGVRQRGRSFPVFPTPDLGTVGMEICYDLVMPEATRCLALAGADIVFVPTMGTAAIGGDDDIGVQALRVRAVENFIWLVVAHRGGGAMIISPQGKIISQAEGADGIAIADIDPLDGREGGDAFNTQRDMRARLFRERNPAAFGILAEMNPPVLAKVPLNVTREEAGRIMARALTVGEEEFNTAAALARAGKTREAIAMFEKLSAEYRDSWIDRVAQERLTKLGPGGGAGHDTSTREAKGIAAKYPGDAGIERDPAVLFAEDFEGGNLPAADWEKEGGFYDVKGYPKEMRITDQEAALGRHSLELIHPEGVVSPQWLHRKFPGQDTVHVRFYRKFEKDWVWPPLGAHDTFLFAGRYKSPTSTDLTLYLDIPQGPSIRMDKKNWDLSRQPELVLRSSFQGSGLDYGVRKEIQSHEGWENFYSLPFNFRPAPVLENGRWYCFEYMAKMNSAPAEKDGEVRLWVDGQLVTEMTGLLLRNAGHPDIKWDHWMLGPRYGDSKEYGKGPPHEQRSWIDAIVVATRYVGP